MAEAPIPVSTPRPVYDKVYEPLALFAIPEHMKHRLFQKSLDQYDDLESSGKDLMRRMSDRNAAVFSDFDIKRHYILGNPFRLILPASTDLEALGEDLEFIAVSYCCHNPDWRPNESDTFKEWPFGQNMVRWLLDFRSSPSTGVWIDAICVDQSNEKEKALTIASMDCIYRDAKKVAYLLEDSRLEPDQVTVLKKIDALVHEETRYFDPHPAFSSKNNLKSMSEAITEILLCRFFDRAWCFHEFSLPRHGSRQWNDSSANYKFIGYEWSKGRDIDEITDDDDSYYARPFTFSVQTLPWGAFYLHWRQHPKFSLSDPDKNEQLDALFMNMFHDITGRSGPKGWLPLIKVFSHIVILNVSMVDDLAPIALNSLTMPIRFRGHVQDTADFHWLSYLLCILSGDACALTSMGWTLQLYLEGAWRYTWVQTSTAWFARLSVPMSLEGVGMISPECIELDLILFRGRFRIPEEWSLSIARDFVQDYLEHSDRKQHSPLGDRSNFKATRTEEEIQESKDNAAMVVAIAVERGLSFTADRWRILLNSLPPGDTFREETAPLILSQPDEQLWSLAYERLFNGASNKEMAKNKDSILPYLTTLLEYNSLTKIAVLGTLQFISGNTIGTIASKRPLEALKQIFDPSDANTGDIVFAMPTMLDRGEYYELNRVWVLKPIKDEEWDPGTFTLTNSKAKPPAGLRDDSTCNKANRVWKDRKQKPHWQLVDKVQLWCPSILAKGSDSLPDAESTVVARKQLIVGSR